MKKKYIVCKIIPGNTDLRITRQGVDSVGDDYTGYFNERSDAESWIMITGKNISEDLTIIEIYTKN